MGVLAKASLVAIDGAAVGQPLNGEEAVEVQFNPATMHVTLAKAAEGRRSTAGQAEQAIGAGNATLTLDLHFDTADEGTTELAEDVRKKTAMVARFMLPTEGSNAPPPRVRFQWGTFVMDGLMQSYTEDLDFFSSQGVPLRAKVAISIKGQNPAFMANTAGPGAADGAGALPPMKATGAPGAPGGGLPGAAGISAGVGLSAGLSLGASVGLSLGDRVGVAIGGESAAEFSARMGLDPGAWRGVAAGLDSTISIDAGVEIAFSAGLTTSPGLGVAVGAEAGASASLEASAGLAGTAAAPAVPGAAPGTGAGFALAASGGVRAAVESVQIARTGAAAAQTVAAFTPPAAAATPAPPALPPPPAREQPRPSLRSAPALPAAAARSSAPPAPAPPRADPRATSFGYGVPLRPREAGAAEERASETSGYVVVSRRARPAAVPVATDPTTPPWRRLPAVAPGRREADAHASGCACGCGGGR